MNFYVSDILYLICVVVIIWKLNIKINPGVDQPMGQNLKMIFGHPAIILFMVIICLTGVTFGVTDRFVPVFLSQDLGASATVLGDKS